MLRRQGLHFRSVGVAWVALSLLPAAAGADSVDAERLKLLPARMQESVTDGSISGAVWLVAHHGQVVALDAVGFSDVENHKPMRADSIVQIMSQTKSFTGVAAMILVEEGKLDLTRPVQDYLPEFKGELLEEKRPDGTTVTRAPEHPITVWQLMCHSSGFGFLPPSGPLSKINYTLDVTLEQAVRGFAREHLQTEPGKKYAYSNMGFSTLGRIIKVVSGQEYSRFVQSRILDPLGMADTFFYPPDSKKDRIAMIYQHDDGKLVLSRGRAQAGDPAAYRAGREIPWTRTGALLDRCRSVPLLPDAREWRRLQRRSNPLAAVGGSDAPGPQSRAHRLTGSPYP